MWSSMRKFVFFALVAGLSLVGNHFMIKPANEGLKASKQRLQANMVRLSEFEKATSAAESLSRQLEELEEAVYFFEQKLPPTSEIHKVLEQVTIIAQKQGLKPKHIKTLNRKQNSGYVEQPLRMTLQGDFTAFYSFLLEMEKLPRIMKVRMLDVDKLKQHEGGITADCTVSIFFQHVVG